MFRVRILFINTLRFSAKQLRQLSQTTENPPSCSKNEKGEPVSTENFEVCTISDCMVDPSKPEPAVVVIGAGIAGLSAAHRLAQCGINNFTVLEATDRPGGRIHSCWLGDVIAEMGSDHISGGSMANPMYNLACQEGLLSTPATRINSHKGLYFTSDGRAIDTSTGMAAYHAFLRLEDEAQLLFSMSNNQKHGSLMNFLNVRTQQIIQTFPEDQRYDIARVMNGLSNELRNRVGEDLSQVSADNYGSLVNIPGGNVKVPLGYVGVLAPLLRDLPECSLKYCKPIDSVRWGAVQKRSGGARAVVRCCDGEEYCADYVIITVSLGVLKQHADKLFCPALPAEKMEAINKLGYGQVDKIFLDYARPFWIWNEGTVKFAWSPDEMDRRDDWTKGLSRIDEVEGSKHVLCAYVGGPEAHAMEKATDEEVAEGVTKVLRQFTGDSSLPYPSNILRSKWSSDPYFCGAYSYMGLKSTVGHQCDLSAPLPGPCDAVPPILLFAGEATCAGHYSTAHGARLSGIREAERIIQLTKKLGGPPEK